MASVSSAGWKRIGYVDVTTGRGFGKISIYTLGGSFVPQHLDIHWFKDWTTNAGIRLETNSNYTYWTDVRITYDEISMFIEVNFNRDIAQLAMLSDPYGWNVAKLYTGILPEGGGTARATAKVGKLNIQNQFIIDNLGNVGIGTDAATEKLAVNGNIRAKEIKVETANWPDYVFGNDYKLLSLGELESYIQQNKHLPDIPRAEEVEKEGVSLGEMNKLLLKKVEELTLYLIEKEKIQKHYERQLADFEEKLKKIEDKYEF